MPDPRIVIIGGGLSGSFMAIILAGAGFRVTVHEKRPDPRDHHSELGRNINLGISRHSLGLLAEVGFEEDLERVSVPLDGRRFHFQDGSRLFQPYAPEGSSQRSLFTPESGVRAVSRSCLNELLVEKARNHPNIEFYFDSKLVSLDPTGGTVEFLGSTGEITSLSADVIIGADGANSMVRCELVRLGRVVEQKLPLNYGYKELCVAAESGGGFALERSSLHLWPNAGYLMIALPNHDGSFRCSLFLPNEGPNSWNTLSNEAAVHSFFAASFPDAVSLMPSLVTDYSNNPVGHLVTLRCWPWHDGRAVLVGDACHTVLPFTGQGVNSAFEDCQTLLRCFQESAPNWSQAFSDFADARKEQTDAIANTGIVMTPLLLNCLHDQQFAREIGGR